MAEFTYTLERYNGPATRYTCPACGHKRTFARYVDATGNHIHETVGRCNRESKCAYHLKPREYFQAAGIEPPIASPRPEVSLPAPVQYIPADIMRATLKAYDHNSFVRYLDTLFSPKVVAELIERYRIGTTRDGGCVFWQIDQENRVRTGKVFLYNSDGHRDKNTPPYFIHKRLKVDHIEQCLFGLHLLSGRPIGLVESEKTAVVMSGLLPDFTWMATGGKTNLSQVHILKGRKVVAFPDSDAFDAWKERLSPYGFRISDALQKHVQDPGYDLADFVPTEKRQAAFEQFIELKDGRVIEMHPAGYPLSWAI